MYTLRYSRFFFSALLLSFTTIGLHASEASVSTSGQGDTHTWTIENDVVRMDISYTPSQGIRLTALTNKEATTTLTGSGSSLFDYTGRHISVKPGVASSTFSYHASDSDWEFMDSSIDDIVLSKALSDQTLGKALQLTFRKEQMQVRMVFEIFDGRAGIRYQTFIRNLSSDHKLMIEQADVIALDLPNRSHHLHYVTNSHWRSTTGSMEEASLTSNADDVPKCLINLYDDHTGWYIAPETNWKTQYGPEVFGKQETPSYYYQLRPFAATSAWSQAAPSVVRVYTCPESFQLVLFPQEEFEYIAVNLTVFSGDIANGKMAVEEHLRKRFHFHHTTTSMMVNDWEWFRNGYRTEDYFVNTVFPKAQAAGFDMILIDDGWNNSTSDGKWITDDGTSRDPIESNTPGIPDMAAFARKVTDAGFRLGLWYSNSGGGHNKGNDLADPAIQQAKKEKIEAMIDQYQLTHQAVDLTQYWQNLDENTYSHPSDNVYRKNVLSRNMMNAVVDEHPDYEFKVTSELDLYPNPGDRMTELLHLPNNGWMTITGNSKPIDAIGIHFGHLPLNAIYLGSGGDPTGKTDDLYAALSGRDVKAWKFPTEWADEALQLSGQLNRWRKSPRVMALTDQMVRPVYLGKGWNSDDASQWETATGPYAWMYADEDRSEALVIATNGGRSLTEAPASYPLRWLRADKQYIVEDVTLDDSGVFTYAFKGTYSGSALNSEGLYMNLYENTSPAKAYWIKELTGESRQVVFADEKTTAYTASLTGNTLTINATGQPSSTGVVIVYGKSEDTTMTCPISFDGNGNGQLVVTDISNNDALYPGDSGKPLRYDFEDYHTTLIKSDENIKENIFNNGNPDAENGKSSVMIMTAVGDYVVYHMNIPFAGDYQIALNYKLSNSYRGTAQFYLIDVDGHETALGAELDESTTGNEKMVTVDLGTVSLSKAGTIGIKMKLVGGGNSGTGKYIGANYITFTRSASQRYELEDYHSTLTKSNGDIKVNTFDNGNPDSEHGFSSVMIMTAVGDYVVYHLPVAFAGTYQATLNYKLSKTNRGTAQFYLVDAGGHETALGSEIDESTTGDEKMVTADLGTVTIATPGTIGLKMQLAGGGNSGTGKYIGANYLMLTRQP